MFTIFNKKKGNKEKQYLNFYQNILIEKKRKIINTLPHTSVYCKKISETICKEHSI